MERFHLYRFPTIDSTQTEAKKPQYRPGDVLLADTQTASYGRRGRTWQAPLGNLYVTMVEEWLGTGHLAWAGYAVGLALYEAIEPLLNDSARLNLKWPNDLLINQLKMTGLILEIENDNLLIGIGMNIAVTPEIDQPVTCLNDHAKMPMQPIEILERFLRRYQYWFEQGSQSGFTAMRDLWLSRAAYLGEDITARLADGTVLTGEFKDIDHTGALVLQTENSQYKVTAADIYLTKNSHDTK